MRRKIPSTAALLAFEASARHVSYTAAAEELSLTQSAICRQIANLEEIVGAPLFRRTRRGVVLTEAGSAYYRKVRRRLDELERDTADVLAHGGSGGVLNLAVVPTFATAWLLPRLPRYLEQHPGDVINLAAESRPALQQEQDTDCAIYTGDGSWKWPEAECSLLLHERLIPVCSPRLIAPRARVTPRQLAALPLIQQSTWLFAWREWFKAAGHPHEGDLVGPRYELFSMSLQAAIAGLGVALLPDYLASRHVASGELVRASAGAELQARSHFLAIPLSRQSPVTERFRDWLLAEAAAAG